MRSYGDCEFSLCVSDCLLVACLLACLLACLPACRLSLSALSIADSLAAGYFVLSLFFSIEIQTRAKENTFATRGSS